MLSNKATIFLQTGMRPTVLFCLLAFSVSLTLHVQSKVICGKEQYTVTNGSSSYCLKCDTCHPGYGLYPVCGHSITYPPSNIGCKLCPNETYSAKLDSAPCHSCQQCAKLEIVSAPCTTISNRICNRTCEKGYFFSKRVPHICQQCSYCCFDGKDEEQLECIKQGLNATGRHCSARLDKHCGPHLSSSTTTQTHLPSLIHSPTLLKLTSSTPHPTRHQVGNRPAVIASSILSGLLLTVSILGFMCYKRKRQIWKLKGKRTESIPPNRNPAQGNHDNTGNATQVPQTVVYCADPRVQALQNNDYAASSTSATPEVPPSVTPQQTDDEGDEFPGVAVQSKRRLKQQSSKETQNNVLKKDGANESLLNPNLQAAGEGFNYKRQDSKGAGQSRPRRHSLDAFKRKFSLPLSERDDYQPLGEEDPDELQGNGQVETKPRRGSVISFKEFKRKMSLPGKGQDYSPIKIEDPDQDRSRIHLTSYTEPIKTEVEPLHQRQKEGSKVEFKCLVQGNKKVFYQWVKDGTEMPGQNSSSLVLDCVEMRDFGCYVCNVNDANDDCIKSPAAVLDVAPRDGMDYKCLSQIDDNTQKKVEILLTKEIHGLGGWKQIAIKYDMEKVERDSLEGSPDAGKTTIGYVKAFNPDLTVYEFCKTLKERNIRRFDIVKELLGHLSVMSSEKTT